MGDNRGKKTVVVVIISVIFLVIIGNIFKPVGNMFSYAGDIIVTPFQRLGNWSSEKIGGIVNFFGSKSSLEKENIELKEEISQLKQDLRDFEQYKTENEELRSALKLKDVYRKYNTIGGNIIAKEPGNWFNTFTIDRGSADGIKVDSAVVNGDGLIGRVAKVNRNSAVIVGIIDPWSKVSAVNSRTGELVICVRGDINLSEKGECRLEYIDPDIENGDVVVTSGITDIYPKNITIGKVKEIHQSENELNSYAVIEPAVNFSKIREAFVLVPK